MPGTSRKAARAARMARFLGLKLFLMFVILTFLFLNLAAPSTAFTERCADSQKTGSKKSRSMYNPWNVALAAPLDLPGGDLRRAWIGCYRLCHRQLGQLRGPRAGRLPDRRSHGQGLQL